VVEVLKRNTHSVVGRFYSENGVQFVTPDNKRLPNDIAVPTGESNGAQHGQIVSVEIIQQPAKRSPPVGHVIEVLGDHMCIMGDVPASMLFLDTPDNVYAYCTHLIRELGPEGFILQSGCDIPANAKLENIKAMVAAATGS